MPVLEAAPGGLLPLVVDLDGTLIYGDTTLACILALGCRPLRLFRAVWGSRPDRAAVKKRLAAAAELDPARLNYHADLLRYLRERRREGRLLVLATGADRRIADAVAQHLGLFDAVLASDGRTNLTGSRKLAAIRDTLDGRDFTYIGNSKTDLAIWREAASGVCVNARKRVARAAAQATRIEQFFGRRRGLRRLFF